MTDDSGRGRKSVTFNRNRRSRSVGTTGHVQTESAVNLVRNTQSPKTAIDLCECCSSMALVPWSAGQTSTRILKVDGSEISSHDEVRTRRSWLWRTSSCASCGSCSPKASSTTCAKRSERNLRLNRDPKAETLVDPSNPPSLAIDDEQRGHRTCLQPVWDVCPDHLDRARVRVRDGRFAAHHGAQHISRCTTTPDICPSTAPVQPSTLDGEEASIYVPVSE